MAAVNRVLNVTKVSPAYWRATFDDPPLNLFDPETFAALRLLMADLSKMTMFGWSFLTALITPTSLSLIMIWCVGRNRSIFLGQLLSASSEFSCFDLVNSHVVSIAAIRGCARGIGSEFALACDMRFASREKSLFGQPEVGAGVIPGAGGLEWLPRLVGRSRALEIALLSDEIRCNDSWAVWLD